MVRAGGGRRGRWSALVGVMAVASALLAPWAAEPVAPALAAPVAATAATPALDCGAIYSQKNGAPHDIRTVSTANGSFATVGAFGAPAGQVNAIGLTGDGRSMYGAMYTAASQRVAIYRWDATTGTTTTVGQNLPADFTNATHGAVNPATGVYYWAGSPSGSASLNVYGYNPATNQFLGLVARIPNAGVAAGQTNGDMAFDSAGTAYMTAGSATQSRLFRLDDDLPTTAGTPRDHTYTQLTTINGTTAINGVAFAGDGYLYVASSSVLSQVNPTTGAVLRNVSLAASDSVDLASCASPNTITARKSFPEGRAASGDQVTVTVTGGGITRGNTGTTTGDDTGLQDQPGEEAGPVLGLSGTTYTVTESGAGAGDPAYLRSWRCLDENDGDALVAEGDGTTGSFTMPTHSNGAGAAVVCTFTNIPRRPAIELDKQAGAPSGNQVGDTITYTFVVTNTGNVALQTPQVEDPKVGTVTCPAGELAPQQSVTCTAAPYELTQGDVDDGKVDNAATVRATPSDPRLPEVGDDDTTSTPIEQERSLALTKAADPTEVGAAGDVVTYTFTVTNTGTVTLRDIAVDDVQAPPAGALDGAPVCRETTLAPGASTTCTATYTVTQDDVDHGRIDDTATASGTPPGGGDPVRSDEAEATVTAAPAPSLALVKTADPATVHGVGETITYSFEVTNTGNVTLSEVAVDDRQAPPAGELDGPITCPATTLAPGDSTTCTATYTVTQADLDNGSVNDSATASGTPPGGGDPVTSDPSEATVTVEQTPALALEKVGDPASVGAVGEVITYTFTLTNNGNVTLSDLSVDDEMQAPAGDLDGPITCEATSLAPAEVTTCTASYTVTQADLDHGEVVNTATASGTPPGGGDPVGSPPVTERVEVDAAPSLRLAKEASPDTVSAAGDVITYTFTVTNTGNVTLSDVAVEDRQAVPAGDLDGPVTCESTSLAPSASTTCTATYTVTQADLDHGRVDDTATASGTPPNGGDLVQSNEADASVPADQAPGVALLKEASPATVSAVGDVITYTFTVTNTGNVTLTDVAVDDQQSAPAGDLDGPVTCEATSLAPAEVTTCTATYTVTQADLDHGSVNDSATASGTPPGGGDPVVSDPSEASVTADPAPGVALVKEASPATVSAVGDVITYTFTVTNTGNVTLSDVAVDDQQSAPAGDLDGPVTCEATRLAPGATTTCSATYTVTQADLDNGSVNDSATASGAPPGGGDPVTSDPSDASVTAEPAPGLELTKAAAPESVGAVGDVITYTFTVRNTGNVTLSEVAVDDQQSAPAGDLDGPVTCEATTLAPAAATTCSATYTVTQADVDHGRVDDTATASGTPPNGGDPVRSNEADASVPVDQAPGVALVKEASPLTVSAVGDVITYRFTVTNTGNVTLDDIAVDDQQSPPAGDLDGPITCPETTLAPGDSTTCTATYTVTQADLDNGSVNDTATASGAPPGDGDPVTSDPSEASVTAEPAPGLELTKAASPDSVGAVGDVITYTFTVTNTGNVTLDDIAVDDNQAPPAGDLDGPVTCETTTLAPGASTFCSVTYTVTQADLDHGRVDDMATASGNPPNGGDPVLSNEAEASVPVDQAPGVALLKEASPATVSAVGDVITYTFTVTNTGNVTLTDVAVDDQQSAPAGDLDGPVTCEATTLAPGATTTCSATYTVTQADLDNGSVNDSATASGAPPGGGDPVTSDPSEASVTAEPAPALELTKAASPESVGAVGDVITYTFTVTNTGNVTLDDIAVADQQSLPAGDLDGPITCPETTLAPGASTTCTGTYTVTQADLDHGRVDDTATASGSPPNGGDPVRSNEADASVPVDQAPGVALVKEASPATVSAVGDVITYRFTVTNTGNVTLDDIAVADQQSPPAGDLDGPITCAETTLAPGDSTTCTATYTVTQADLDNGSVNDSATASGTPPPGGGDPVTSDPSDASVTAEPRPGLELTKAAAPDSVGAVGDVITYTFTVRNTGNVTLSDLTVDDQQAPPAGDLDGPVTCEATTLAPDASTNCTGTYTVTQADLDHGRVDDTATASGAPPNGGEPVRSNEAEASVPVDQAPGVALLKEASPATVSAVGDVITYTFTVTNTGNVTLDDIAVDDQQSAPAGDLDGPITCPETTLAPGNSTTCSATYTVAQADLDNGSVNDSATASGAPPGGGDPVISDPSDASVTAEPAPGLELTKSASPATVSAVGDVITYTFTVTNTGNITLDDITVDDDQAPPAGDLDGPITCAATTLAPAAATTCTATYTVTQADLDHGRVEDTATASGNAPNGGDPVRSNEADASVPVVQAPSIGVVKAGTPAAVTTVGEQVSYTFTVTNTGNVTLTDVAVDDVQAPPAGDLDGPVTCPETTLAPGASTVCTATYTVTRADLEHGRVDDRATASGTPPGGAEPVRSEESPFTVPTDAPASYDAAKTADPATGTKVEERQRVRYTLRVTNTGQTALRVPVTDDLSGVLDDATYAGDVAASTGEVTVTGARLSWTGLLEPGETLRITYSVVVKAYPAQGDHRLGNVMVVHAEGGPCGPDRPCTTEHPTVPPPPPAVAGEGEDEDDDQPPLPDTGGPPGALLVGGLLALLAGALLVASGRRHLRHQRHHQRRRP